MWFPVLAALGHYRPRFLVVDKDTHYEDKNKTNNVEEGDANIHRLLRQLMLLHP